MTADSLSVICAFSEVLTEKRAAGELTLYFSVYLTLCHTDEKDDLSKGNLVVGPLIAMEIKDCYFPKTIMPVLVSEI